MTNEKKKEFDKVIDWVDAKEIGLLMRINQEFLFPMGLAIAVDINTRESPVILVSPDGVYEYDTSIKKEADKAKEKGNNKMYEEASLLARPPKVKD